MSTDREFRFHPAFRFDERPERPEIVWEGYLHVRRRDGTLRFKRAPIEGDAFAPLKDEAGHIRSYAVKAGSLEEHARAAASLARPMPGRTFGVFLMDGWAGMPSRRVLDVTSVAKSLIVHKGERFGFHLVGLHPWRALRQVLVYPDGTRRFRWRTPKSFYFAIVAHAEDPDDLTYAFTDAFLANF